MAWLAFALVAANIADVDFVLGYLFGGGINSWHRGATHSLLAAVSFGAACAALLGNWLPTRRRMFLIATGLYLSHLLLDFATAAGVPLLWPFVGESLRPPLPVLQGVDHGAANASLGEFVQQLFSRRNLLPLGIELMLLVPPALALWRIRDLVAPKHPQVDADPLSIDGDDVEPVSLARSPDAVGSSKSGEDSVMIAQLTARIESLERQSRWTQLGILVAVALIPLIVIVLRNLYGSTVSAEQFVLRDPEGTPRAAMVVKDGKEPYLIFFGNEGEDRAVIGVDRSGQPLFGLLDGEQNPRLSARLHEAELPVLSLQGAESHGVVLQVDEDNQARIVFKRGEGRDNVTIP